MVFLFLVLLFFLFVDNLSGDGNTGCVFDGLSGSRFVNALDVRGGSSAGRDGFRGGGGDSGSGSGSRSSGSRSSGSRSSRDRDRDRDRGGGDGDGEGGDNRWGGGDASLPLVPDYLGKDRELVHFAVDLRWIWEQLTDMDTYMNFLHGAWQALVNLVGAVNGSSSNNNKGAKPSAAIDILSYIRAADPVSPLKMFHGTNLSRADWFAAATGRLLLVYVEEGSSSKPSAASVGYRVALSDPGLGTFINDKVMCDDSCEGEGGVRGNSQVYCTHSLGFRCASVCPVRQHHATHRHESPVKSVDFEGPVPGAAGGAPGAAGSPRK